MRRPVLTALLIALAPLCAAAQQRPDEGHLSPRIFPAFGVHYGTPLRLSGAVGIIVDLDADARNGAIALVEPGKHGIKFSAGYLHWIGRFGTGYSLRAAIIRTDDDPWEAEPDATYVGAEAHFMVILGAGGRAGLFRRTGGLPGRHDTMATLGVSLGL